MKNRKNLLQKFLDYVIRVYEWGLFLGQFQVSYLNLAVFSFLQLTNMAAIYSVQYASIFLSYIVLTAVLAYIPLLYWIVARAFKRGPQAPPAFEQKFGIIFTFFHRNSFLQCGYYLVITLRQLAFAFILTVLNDCPALSLCLLILTNMVVIYLTLRVSPYKKRIYQWKDIVTEISFALIHYMSFYLVNNDRSKIEERAKLGWAIVSLVMVIMLMNFLVLFREQFEMIKELCQKCRQRALKVSDKEKQLAKRTRQRPEMPKADSVLHLNQSLDTAQQNITVSLANNIFPEHND